jgi:hypothetical protein
MGQSLLPLLNENAPTRDNSAISELFSNGRRMRSYRRPGRKLIKDFTTGCTWIYDLESDPREARPLHLQTSTIVAEAQRDAQLGEAWLAALRRSGPGPRVVRRPTGQKSGIPSEVLQQLESLGYIGSAED